jgi:cell division protease FtsH
MTIDTGLASGTPPLEASSELRSQWRLLTLAATGTAIVTSPAAYLWFHRELGWAWYWALLATVGAVAAFRGLVDVGFRRLIPWPSLFGVEDRRLKEDDVLARRRAWFWTRAARLAVLVATAVTLVFVGQATMGESVTWLGTAGALWHGFWAAVGSRTLWTQLLFVLALLLSNFAILLGPLLLMGISQIRGYEPGDAEWGVRLQDVRGQAEAKEEVRRVVSLWQSGEAFEQAGGKRERGLLFLGAPGTGKTMLAKAIATGFNSPFVSIPGSGFAQAFLGIDAVIVRLLVRKAKRLAAKWGGQCIVFIDEIDAVGMRRQAVQGSPAVGWRPSIHDYCFHGPFGALTESGDLVYETQAWRERLFEARAPERRSPYPPIVRKLGTIVNQAIPGMMGGQSGQLALNQLLVSMDGIDNPPFLRRVLTSRVNTILDALFVVPRRVGNASLRLPAPRPRREQVYFIGATNIPMDRLDPALTRPGRLGRHVWFRTPTKRDRVDIFDLYLDKVGHDRDLDTPRRRDELARVTNGYSPAMIEQVCSMALTHAHHDGRTAFRWDDLLQAMTTVEAGTAIGVDYVPDETRAVAIHEAGHAATAHVFMKGSESTRLSIKMRGGSLGHHMALEKEERFSSWHHEEMGRLIWGLGAMAAERVFYGETSMGVGGDVHSVTVAAGLMVGSAAMGPQPLEANGGGKLDDEARARIMGRFETIGTQIMSRRGAGGPADVEHNPVGAVFADREKRALAARILGQAYVTAHAFVEHNRDAVARIADVIVERRELYGDELVELLESVGLEQPSVDLTKDEAWPVL